MPGMFLCSLHDRAISIKSQSFNHWCSIFPTVTYVKCQFQIYVVGYKSYELGLSRLVNYQIVIPCPYLYV